MLKVGECYKHVDNKGFIYKVIRIDTMEPYFDIYDVTLTLGLSDSHSTFSSSLTKKDMETKFIHLPVYNSPLYKAVNNG